MRIVWTIKKRRGNWRPVLSGEMTKEDWELALAVPGGSTGITIPTPRGWQRFATPEGENWEDNIATMAILHLPGPEELKGTLTVLLPWRRGARPEYPEVEAAMEALMREWERRVEAALASGEMDCSGEVEHSPEYKQRVAPYVAARRMLGS